MNYNFRNQNVFRQTNLSKCKVSISYSFCVIRTMTLQQKRRAWTKLSKIDHPIPIVSFGHHSMEFWQLKRWGTDEGWCLSLHKGARCPAFQVRFQSRGHIAPVIRWNGLCQIRLKWREADGDYMWSRDLVNDESGRGIRRSWCDGNIEKSNVRFD